MDLRNIEATLPPGFRFYPSDQELVCHYLFKKITNEGVLKGTMVEVDLHTCEPWQLPDVAKLGTNEWYFFSFRDRKYATGLRTNRATKSGYWKATGKDRPVFDSITHAIVGMRKTLVFYQNRAPNGIKTGWVMHEFRLENPQMPPKDIESVKMDDEDQPEFISILSIGLGGYACGILELMGLHLIKVQEDWVLCRVFHKSKEERLEQEMRSIAGVSSPSLISCPPIDQRIQNVLPSFAQVPHHQDHIPSTLPNIALLNPSHQDYAQEFSSKVDDEYGFLFDMSSLEDGGPPHLDEMRFHEESSTVFF